MSAPDFWKTMKGLLARVADIAHHFTWSTLNTGVKEELAVVEDDYQATTGEPSGLKLYWATMDDEKVCDYCNDQQGEYSFDDLFLPMIPGHVMCRCWWEIE